jgi:hypothetical protein
MSDEHFDGENEGRKSHDTVPLLTPFYTSKGSLKDLLLGMKLKKAQIFALDSNHSIIFVPL